MLKEQLKIYVNQDKFNSIRVNNAKDAQQSVTKNNGYAEKKSLSPSLHIENTKKASTTINRQLCYQTFSNKLKSTHPLKPG